MRKPLSNSQIVCITLLYAVLCYLLITTKPIDGMTVFSIVAATVIIFVPIYKSIKRR